MNWKNLETKCISFYRATKIESTYCVFFGFIKLAKVRGTECPASDAVISISIDKKDRLELKANPHNKIRKNLWSSENLKFETFADPLAAHTADNSKKENVFMINHFIVNPQIERAFQRLPWSLKFSLDYLKFR